MRMKIRRRLRRIKREIKMSKQDILNRFSFHKPDEKGVEDMRAIRRKVRDLASEIDVLCPESPSKATALTQLSFVMMSANSAIVQQFPIDEKDV
jgi:hypothetical protein